MFAILEDNLEILKNEETLNNYNYKCEDDLYGILLKTGQYINATDINYQLMKLLLLFKNIKLT